MNIFFRTDTNIRRSFWFTIRMIENDRLEGATWTRARARVRKVRLNDHARC